MSPGPENNARLRDGGPGLGAFRGVYCEDFTGGTSSSSALVTGGENREGARGALELTFGAVSVMRVNIEHQSVNTRII